MTRRSNALHTARRQARDRWVEGEPTSAAAEPATHPHGALGGGLSDHERYQRAFYADRVLSRIFGTAWRRRLPRMYAALLLHHELPIRVGEMAVGDGRPRA